MSKFYLMPSQTIENYIKSIYHLSESENNTVSTSALSEKVSTSAASVTDMLKKLADQGLIEYMKYRGVRLTTAGKSLALSMIRKHRIWETFLHEKLGITWDEVHEIAEQLEHVESNLLIDKLDEALGFPKYDPHGDPIPDSNGKFTFRLQVPLLMADKGVKLKVVGVKDHQPSFLKYLDSIPLALDHTIEIKEKFEFDSSLMIVLDNEKTWTLSSQASENILVKIA